MLRRAESERARQQPSAHQDEVTRIRQRGERERGKRTVSKTVVTGTQVGAQVGVEVPVTQYPRTPQQLVTPISGDISSLEVQKASIDPLGLYIYQGQQISGVHAIEIISQQISERKQLVSDIERYPKGTTFTPTKTGGYTVNIPESERLKWARYHLKETEKLPPVLQQLGEAKFFFQTSTLSLAAPLTRLFGGKAGEQGAILGVTHDVTKLRGMSEFAPTHFPSLMDVAFEPIGWSPEGSTELIKQYPVGAILGGGAAEIAQGIAFTKAGGLLKTKVVVPGTKKVISKLPGLYGKFTTAFPEEKIISPIAKKLYTPWVKIGTGTQKLADFGSRLYKWGARGYDFSKQLSRKTVVPKTVQEISELGIKTTSKTTVYRSTLKTQRVLLSPLEKSFAEKEIAQKIASGYKWSFGRLVKKETILNIFPTDRPLLESMQLVKLVTPDEKLVNTLDDIARTALGTPKGKMGKWVTYPKTGVQPSIDEAIGVFRGQVTPEGEILGDILGIAKLKRKLIWERGFKELQITSLGKYQTELPKTWIVRYRPPFLQNTIAQLKLVEQKIVSGVKPTSIIRGKTGLDVVTVPARGFGAELGTALISRPLITQLPDYKRKPDVVTVTDRKQIPLKIVLPESIQGRKPDGIQVPDIDRDIVPVKIPVTETVPAQDIVQILSPRLDIVTMVAPPTKVVPPRPVHMFTPKPPIVPFWLPEPKLSGRGTRGMDWRGRKSVYKFRKAKVGTPFSIMNRFKKWDVKL